MLKILNNGINTAVLTEMAMPPEQNSWLTGGSSGPHLEHSFVSGCTETGLGILINDVQKDGLLRSETCAGVFEVKFIKRYTIRCYVYVI